MPDITYSILQNGRKVQVTGITREGKRAIQGIYRDAATEVLIFAEDWPAMRTYLHGLELHVVEVERPGAHHNPAKRDKVIYVEGASDYDAEEKVRLFDSLYADRRKWINSSAYYEDKARSYAKLLEKFRDDIEQLRNEMSDAEIFRFSLLRAGQRLLALAIKTRDALSERLKYDV